MVRLPHFLSLHRQGHSLDLVEDSNLRSFDWNREGDYVFQVKKFPFRERGEVEE